GIGTVVYVATNDVLLGKIYVNDTIKQNSIKTLKELNDLNIETYMLTGDNDATAQAIGKELGINKNNIYSQLLPQDKISILEKLKLDSKKGVIFVGDGINDAPALAISDVGISMGKIGSDIAVESSDIVLMNDDPYKIIESLKIAKLNKNVVWQNIVLALGIKIIVMILGILGLANLWMAIFADVGVSIIAVINASKLLRNKR
ncbi:MAG: HAD-IC family P-type ATPase, partial [Cetobacterium sp.]